MNQNFLRVFMKWHEEGKSFDEIKDLLPASLKPNRQVLSGFVNRQTKKKNRDHDMVTIPISIPRETLVFLLDTFATLLVDKIPAQLRQHLAESATQHRSASRSRYDLEASRANSELARKAALAPARPKLNKDVLELLPEPPRQ